MRGKKENGEERHSLNFLFCAQGYGSAQQQNGPRNEVL